VDEYISIKDFAKQAGVSTQAIYQRLDKDLSKYLQVVGKKKKLSIKGLELFILKEKDNDPSNVLVDSLQATIQLLTSQIDVKDNQIQALNEALLNSQQQASGAQALHASTLLTDNQATKRSVFSRFFKGRND